MLKIDYDPGRGKFIVTAPFQMLALCKAIPVRAWDKEGKCWVAPITKSNVEYFKKFGRSATDAARNAFSMIDAPPPPKVGVVPGDYSFKRIPREHQWEGLIRGLVREAFAYLMDPGTGKTNIIINDFAIAYLQKLIGAVVIICPNSVKSNWYDELILDWKDFDEKQILIYEPDRELAMESFLSKPMDKLTWLIIGTESFSHVSRKAYDYAMRYVLARRAAVAVDESSRIKNFKGMRTELIISLGKQSPRKRIASGTSMTKGIHYGWSQMEFLDPEILGCMNYYAFRNHFCIMGGYKGKKIIVNKNEEEFLDMIAPYVYRADKSVLKLPPKIPMVRKVQPSAEQLRIYTDLSRKGLAIVDGKTVSYQYIITREMRLHQISGGFVSLAPEIPLDALGNPDFYLAQLEAAVNEPIKGPNPKIEDMKEAADEVNGKLGIWCRFIPEINAVVDMLRERDDGEVVVFHGKISEEDRTSARRRFQNDPKVKYWVGQQDSGGIGITLHAAHDCWYFSNSFSAETRIQSEDRFHRDGQTHSVTYTDWLIDAPDWIDTRILQSVQMGIDYNTWVHQQIERRQNGDYK